MSVSRPTFRRRTLTLPGDGTAEIYFEEAAPRVKLVTTHRTAHGGGEGSGGWLKCREPACLGDAGGGGACFVHSTPDEQRAVLASLSGARTPLNLQGVEIETGFLMSLLTDPAVSSSVDGKTQVDVAISLTGAIVHGGPLNITNFVFAQYLNMTGVILQAQTQFRNVEFRENLSLRYLDSSTTAVSFADVEFKKGIDVSYAHSKPQTIGLASCVVRQRLVADGMVGGALHLGDSEINADVSITFASVSLLGERARFLGSVDLQRSEFQSLNLKAATFPHARDIGPLVGDWVTLAGSRFGARVTIDVSAKNTVDLSGSRFESGGTLRVGAKELVLRGLELDAPLLVAGDRATPPQIRALEGVDARELTVSTVDLKRCLFAGAHGLDGLRIESGSELLDAPRRKMFTLEPWRDWRTNRRCIADELAWRVHSGERAMSGWDENAIVDRDPDNGTRILPREISAREVSSLYRALRRGLETRADEPGAADFYYGEMEMRRLDSGRPFGERIVVWLYWVTAGYGLRATRAVTLLCSLVLMAAWLFATAGTDPSVGLPTGLSLAARSALPGLDAADAIPLNSAGEPVAAITGLGEVVDISLAVLGPVLVVLIGLAIRGRVVRR